MTDYEHSTADSGPSVFLVEEQPNPSTDYFVLPALSASGARVRRYGFRDVPAVADLMGATVVFVRYVPGAWARLVRAARQQLHGLIFFMDDDVLDMRAAARMPWHYRFKLARLAAGRRDWLQKHGAQLWVSTPYLQQKYAKWQPRLVLPAAMPAADQYRRVFYHGTASHDAEKRWLRPVAEEVLRRDDRMVLEIVGGQTIDRLFRGLPRVNVVHQMKWPAYQAFLALPGRHIGLAPLLRLPFNRARSYTKFFDITRCGAAGIYADHGACAEVVTDGEDGLLVPQKHEAWVEAILRLAQDETLRQALVRNAGGKLAALALEARSGYPGLIAP